MDQCSLDSGRDTFVCILILPLLVVILRAAV